MFNGGHCGKNYQMVAYAGNARNGAKTVIKAHRNALAYAGFSAQALVQVTSLSVAIHAALFDWHKSWVIGGCVLFVFCFAVSRYALVPWWNRGENDTGTSEQPH